MIGKLTVSVLLLAALVLWGPLTHAQGTAGLPTVTTVDALLNQPGGLRYLDAHQVTLPSAEGAGYYDVLQRVDSAGLDWHLRRYTLPAKGLVLEQFFTGIVPLVLEGPSREWYASGQLREEVLYHKERVAGTLRTYYPSGKPRRVQVIGWGASTVCYDSLGTPLRKCPPYHTFATLRGKNTYSGKFLQVVQQQYPRFLPADYHVAPGQLVYYAFRIDPTGAVREPRILSGGASELQGAVLQALKQLPTFEPALYEGEVTDDVLEGYVQVK